MKNTLFVATYYNNAHFIELQSRAFRKFVEDDYDFVVLDDSEESTRSILTNNLSRDDIRNECHRHGAMHVMVPQSIHRYKRDGGYVPDDSPTVDHPTERHQACLRWWFANYKQLGLDQYKTMVLLDADALIRKPINVSNYMTHDFISTKRDQPINLPYARFPNYVFSDKIKSVDKTTITFFTLFIMFINISNVNNLETMDIGSWPETDTGSKTNFFIRENPQYTYHFLSERHNSEYRIDVVSKDPNFTQETAELIHYRAGSNWLYEKSDYYRVKLNRMLKGFIPEIFDGEVSITQDIVSRDGEHIIKK